jgi:hypothetical protein
VRIVQDLPVGCDDRLLELWQSLPFRGKVAGFAQCDEAIRLDCYGLIEFWSEGEADCQDIALR